MKLDGLFYENIGGSCATHDADGNLMFVVMPRSCRFAHEWIGSVFYPARTDVSNPTRASSNWLEGSYQPDLQLRHGALSEQVHEVGSAPVTRNTSVSLVTGVVFRYTQHPPLPLHRHNDTRRKKLTFTIFTV